MSGRELNEMPPTPTHGAALRYVLEMIGPLMMACRSDAEYGLIEARLRPVDAWTVSQPQNVQIAYKWAIRLALGAARERVDLFKNAAAVSVAYEHLPKPPKEDER